MSLGRWVIEVIHAASGAVIGALWHEEPGEKEMVWRANRFTQKLVRELREIPPQTSTAHS